jgi:hypothetical protein
VPSKDIEQNREALGDREAALKGNKNEDSESEKEYEQNMGDTLVKSSRLARCARIGV